MGEADPCSVYLVDDQPVVLRTGPLVVNRAMRGLGMTADVVALGTIADFYTRLVQAGIPDIAFLDQVMPGGDPAHILVGYLADHPEVLEGRRMGIIRMSGHGSPDAPIEGLPDSVRVESLHKPFGVDDLRPVLERIRAHLMGRMVETVPHLAHGHGSTEVVMPPTRDPNFRGISSFMLSLPRDPEDLTDSFRDFDRVARVVRPGLTLLRQPSLTGNIRAFLEKMRDVLPVEKKASLLSLLETPDSIAAMLALDCLWHDLNNAMMAAQNPSDLQGGVPSDLVTHLKQVESAFRDYESIGSMDAFMADQQVRLGRMHFYYPGHLHIRDWNPRMRIHAPVGALHSILTTFPNNAFRVGARYTDPISLHLTSFEDGTGEAVVMDSWRPFSEDQLEHLFDRPLASGSWGTGLWRLARVMDEISPEERCGAWPSLMMMQRDGNGDWIQKRPGVEPFPMEEADVRELLPNQDIPEWVAKAFILRFV